MPYIKIKYELDHRVSTRFFESLLKLDAYLAGLQRAGMAIKVLEEGEATQEEYNAYQVELNKKATKALGEARQRSQPPPDEPGMNSGWRGKITRLAKP